MRHLMEIWGLLLNIAGTGLLLRWPPQVTSRYSDGSQAVLWKNNPQSSGKVFYWLQKVGGRTGLVLLLIGFTLQFCAEFAI
jgi:hypothetical protein